MLTSVMIDTAMIRQFEEQWHALICSDGLGDGENRHHNILMECCPVTWLVDDLLKLLCQKHHQPATALEPMIRRIVLEQDFIGNMGNVSIGHRRHDMVDQYVDVLVQVLEQVRQHAWSSGHWSNAPSPVQFFG
jgi:hypothetical protein